MSSFSSWRKRVPPFGTVASLMSSRGASATAFTGRGSSTEMSRDSYRVVLPSLPTGTEVLNYVFAHCDTSGRPYKIDDFRTQMERHGVLQDLIGAGQYQMNHVWLFTFNSLTAKRKLLAAKELVVKEKRCLLIDPDECEVRLRLHWTPIHISDDAVRRALEPYGKVNEVSRDTWRVEGFQNVQTTTRFVKMNLKEGTTKDHLPHQLVMFGSKVLVVVPGRAPLCLRCKRTGHIRRVPSSPLRQVQSLWPRARGLHSNICHRDAACSRGRQLGVLHR
ncbi:unnamed protein product [Ixodes persulcatus]